jgi:hypothetical protein
VWRVGFANRREAVAKQDKPLFTDVRRWHALHNGPGSERRQVGTLQFVAGQEILP